MGRSENWDTARYVELSRLSGEQLTKNRHLPDRTKYVRPFAAMCKRIGSLAS